MIERVGFRVDSGTVIGAGHLARCLALAGALAERGVASCFVGRNHEGHLLDLARAAGHESIVLETTTEATHDPDTWLGGPPEADARATVATLHGIDSVGWLIVDHYAIDATWHDQVRGSCVGVMAIDDLANRQMKVDVLLDHNYGATEKPYAQVAPHARQLLGPRYALLDPRFEHARAGARATTSRPKHECRVLIGLGGTDPNDATSWVLTSLAEDLSQAAAVDVVIGRSHPAPHDVRRAVQSLPNALLHVQTGDMPSLLANADIAIGAGGVSTLERACIGVPSVGVALAPNQLSALRALDRDGLLLFAGGDLGDVEYLREGFRALMSDLERRARMSAACRHAVDGRGLERVADVLLAELHDHAAQNGESHA